MYNNLTPQVYITMTMLDSHFVTFRPICQNMVVMFCLVRHMVFNNNN